MVLFISLFSSVFIFGFCSTSYVKVFNHNSSFGVFANASDALMKNRNNSDAPLYSILDSLEAFRDVNGKFELKLCYPEFGIDYCNEWRQTSNPVTESSITGFEAISLSFTTSSTNGAWRGLGRNLEIYESTTLIDDSPFSSGWYSAVGAFYNYRQEKKILGPRNRKVEKVELFAKRKGFECKEGWTWNNATFKCYKFVQKKLTWSEAHRDCLSMIPTLAPPKLPITRGNLASIKDEEENKFVTSLVEKDGCEESLQASPHIDTWLGGHLLGDGSWIWIDGSNWTYDNWSCGQAVREDTLYLGKNGDWGVGRFSNILCGYVCQYLDLNQFSMRN